MRLSSVNELKMMKGHEKTGRPLGSNSFIDKIEHAVGRVLRPSKTRTQKEETQQLSILSPELIPMLPVRSEFTIDPGWLVIRDVHHIEGTTFLLTPELNVPTVSITV